MKTSPLYEKCKVSVHIKPTDKPVVRDYKTQVVDKQMFADYPCFMIMPFVANWPTVMVGPSFIRDNTQIQVCNVPQDLSERINGLQGHVVCNLIFHLNTGDWVLHVQDARGTQIEYEWTETRPMYQDHYGNMGQWVRENEKPMEDIPELVDVLWEQNQALEASKDE
jgi:hypothetical protein